MRTSRQLAFGMGLWVCAASAALLPSVTARGQDPPPAPLERVTAGVTGFLARLSDVECTEQVTQIDFAKSGKIDYQEHSTFDYVVLTQNNAEKPSVVESRLAKQAATHRKDLPLLVTNGFATLLLIFHPYYEPSFEFAPPVTEILDGKPTQRIDFRHIKGLRTTTALLEQGREYPLELSGSAWIDPASGAVVKMRVGLESPMTDIGLKDFRAEVRYAPVTFHDNAQPFWLPASAAIDVESLHHRWRNLHEFTAYHLFSTSVETKVGSTP